MSIAEVNNTSSAVGKPAAQTRYRRVVMDVGSTDPSLHSVHFPPKTRHRTTWRQFWKTVRAYIANEEPSHE